MNRIPAMIVSAFFALGAAPALADQDHAKHQAAAGTAEMIDGEVRKVDKETKKITIKHGPMKSFDMPGMTMVFQVKDPKMLDQVKAGDKVKFQADLLPGGKTVITRIEVVK